MNNDILNLFMDSQATRNGTYYEDDEPDKILLDFTKENVLICLDRVFNFEGNELDQLSDLLSDITDTKKLYETLLTLLETYRTVGDLKHSLLNIAKADK